MDIEQKKEEKTQWPNVVEEPNAIPVVFNYADPDDDEKRNNDLNETESFNVSFTKEQVTAWFKTHFPEFAALFKGLTAKAVLSLTKQEITEVIPGFPGIMIYKALHPAKQGTSRTLKDEHLYRLEKTS